MVGESDPSVVVLDLGTTSDIDIDGADTLTKIAEQLRSRGIRLLLARVDGERLDLLRRAGTLKAIGDENLFVTVRDAVSANTGQKPSTPSACDRAARIGGGPQHGR